MIGLLNRKAVAKRPPDVDLLARRKLAKTARELAAHDVHDINKSWMSMTIDLGFIHGRRAPDQRFVTVR